MAKKYSTHETDNTAADLGYKTTLSIAEKNKHVTLGAIFIKYISEAINAIHIRLIRSMGKFEGAGLS